VAGASPLGPASPFFIVADITAAVAFYCDRLGFKIRLFAPEEDPFFAIVGRDVAQFFFKSEAGIAPQPNRKRHLHMAWDAFVHVADPDALAADIAARGATFAIPLHDTHDGLRGFAVDDADNYRLFFGRPHQANRHPSLA
jgi:catechol 2,3-dioxygenase-like lactoylglutathione lyase family enzyme